MKDPRWKEWVSRLVLHGSNGLMVPRTRRDARSGRSLTDSYGDVASLVTDHGLGDHGKSTQGREHNIPHTTYVSAANAYMYHPASSLRLVGRLSSPRYLPRAAASSTSEEVMASESGSEFDSSSSARKLDECDRNERLDATDWREKSRGAGGGRKSSSSLRGGGTMSSKKQTRQASTGSSTVLKLNFFGALVSGATSPLTCVAAAPRVRSGVSRFPILEAGAISRRLTGNKQKTGTCLCSLGVWVCDSPRIEGCRS